jgi:C4-dicarboxylate-specific signal transduction histidine kinase
VRLLLESAGYEVAVARNGREGLPRVQVAPPDLIIADVVMPEMDGYAFSQAVKTAPATRRLPFVLLTDRRAPAEKSNAELRQLALALEDRVAQRTAELREANEPLQRELEERKRAEEALQQKDEELRLISQQLWQDAKLATMGELAASIAHELNNPLATVSLRVESLLAHVLAPDPRRRALEVIAQEVERMGNLVANLLQFSRRGHPQIAAIAPEHLPKVLEPFFTTKAEGKGTGLGLAICKRIVQEHHGMFTLASEVSEGTTVRIVLPLTHAAHYSALKGGACS